MNKKDNFAMDNLVRTIRGVSSSIAKEAVFGKGATLGTFYSTYIELDNFTKPIDDFILLDCLKNENFEVSSEGDPSHTHTVKNPMYIKNGDRILCVEIGADIVVIGGAGNA